MSYTKTSRDKSCLSCEYWGGPREVKGSGSSKRAETISNSTKGKCGKTRSDKLASASCHNFWPWGSLK